MRKTKIVCTIGPATRSESALKELVYAGMNVARLNFSHGDHEYHKENIDLIKKIRLETGAPLAILLDTKGPEIRVRKFENDSVIINDGDDFILTTREVTGTNKEVSVTYKDLPKQVFTGVRILVDDGNIELCVSGTTATDVICTVVHGGKISNNKSINIPLVHLDMPYLSEVDKKDILFGIENDVDFIAASFVRNPDDVTILKNFLLENGGEDIKIISKIENTEGVENFDKILTLSDGIMVARGDMGVEVAFERLPGLQKEFIQKCFSAGKVVITATQMLESMINNPRPTRAEISDVANAVFDGTSAIMLSGETAAGKYPIEATRAMAKIAEQAEFDAFYMNRFKNAQYEEDSENITNAVCDAACTTARDIRAKAIIAITKYGRTARFVSKFRPAMPIVAAVPEVKTYHQLSLSWGVYPIFANYKQNLEELFMHSVECTKKAGITKDGDVVVLVAGYPLDTAGNTNIVRVAVTGQKTT